MFHHRTKKMFYFETSWDVEKTWFCVIVNYSTSNFLVILVHRYFDIAFTLRENQL